MLKSFLIKWLRQFLSATDEEITPALGAAATMFCLLASHFVMLPLREEAGVSLGTDVLPKLVSASLVGVVVVTPLTSLFLSRHGHPKEVLLKRFYTFLALILLAFYALYHTSLLHGHVSSILDTRELTAAGSEQVQEFVRHKGDASMDAFQRTVRCAFYVWLNVQNLVVLSCMWARCADVFSSEAASRLFGLISAGATAGQLVGSLTAMVVTRTAPLVSLPMCMVIPVAAGLMYMAALLSAVSQRLQEHLGGVLEGFALIAASSYLMLLCGYLLMTYIVGSLMYFQRSLVVAAMVKAANDRTEFFATVYSFSAVVICGLQLLATGRLLRFLGITLSLSAMPLVCMLGILGVGVQPSTTTVAMAEILRKVVGYSMVRPAREVLYTVVTREEKYKAKLSIDSVVQRLGDTVAAAVFEVLDVQMHLGLSGVAVAGAALCLVWIVWAVRLGRRHALLSSHSSARLIKA